MTLSLKPILYLFWSFMSLVFLSEFEKQVTTYHNAGQSERFLPALPFCLLFGVLFAGLTDTLFHDGIRVACRHPFGRGVNYFGWLLGCLLSLSALGRLARMHVGALLEMFVPACLPAQALGRIGCFLGGCCYGIPVDSSWGIVYPRGSIPFAAHGSAPLAPVQLYEAGWLLVSYVIVLSLVRKGHRAGVSLIAMGAGRFALEFLRGDPRGSLFCGVPLSPAQCLAIVLVAVGMLVLLGSRGKGDGRRTCG